MRRHAAVRPMEAIQATLQASMHRVRRIVAPRIIAIRTAGIRTAPATETTARATTIILGATGLSIPAIRAITIVPAEMVGRTIAPGTITLVTTARATIIVRTTAIVPITVPIIAPVMAILTGLIVRVIGPV